MVVVVLVYIGARHSTDQRKEVYGGDMADVGNTRRERKFKEGIRSTRRERGDAVMLAV
jgi:hypothetical protein